MSIITGMRLTSALSGGSMTAATLTTALATAAGQAGWKAAVASTHLCSILVNDPTARAAWSASSSASAAFFLHPDAVRRLFGYAIGLEDVLSRAQGSAALFASRVARQLLWASDAALAVFAASSQGKTSARESAVYSLVNVTLATNSTATIPGMAAGRYILLGVSRATNNATLAIEGRRPGSSVGSIAFADAPIGTTATGENIVALQGSATARIGTSGPLTFYFGSVSAN